LVHPAGGLLADWIDGQSVSPTKATESQTAIDSGHFTAGDGLCYTATQGVALTIMGIFALVTAMLLPRALANLLRPKTRN